MSGYKKIIFSLFIILSSLISCYFLYGQHNQTSSVNYVKTTFATLPNWNQDNHLDAFIAFQQSCKEINKRNPQLYFDPQQLTHVSEWQAICRQAMALKKPTDLIAREFFETAFQPYHIKTTPNSGLFTGYYIPLLQASLTKNTAYHVPIYGLPTDLITIDLSSFHITTHKKIMIGQLKQHHLSPYPTRAEINTHPITNAPILAWGNNDIDLFFAQIQGSFYIELPNKKQLLLNYAGTNGHPYTAIGKILVAQHAIEKNKISMQSIRAWLEQHPEHITAILNQNASYVFFERSTNSNPIGNENVPLTPKRSLAVDKTYISLGTPVWLDTTLPATPAQHQNTRFQHLVIAQDTGGAIKGAVRGDVYWGTGSEAAYFAGQMQSPGQYWVLLPRYKNK